MRTLAEDVIPPPIAALSIRDRQRHPISGTTRPIKVSITLSAWNSPLGEEYGDKTKGGKGTFHYELGKPVF